MYSANTIADFFVDISQKTQEEPMTNLRVLKFLYFAQAWHLAQTGKPLFSEEIEAWDFGPVVPCVYHAYKVFKKEPIVLPQEFEYSQIKPETQSFLMDVFRMYSKYTTAALVNITHRTTEPWYTVYNSSRATIEKEQLKECYQKKSPLQSFDSILNRMPEEGRHDADGHLILPEDDWGEPRGA